jgi:hypothetical protein
MEFWITIVGLVRRKGVVIPALLIAVALAVTAYLMTPISYVSSSTMVLTTTQFGGTESRDPTKPTDLTNPLLNFNDSLTTTSAILIEAMNTGSVDRQLGITGSTQLVVDDGRTNPDLLGLNGPFLYIVGRSTSPAEAKRVVLDAQTLTREKLAGWQRSLNAPEKTYVGLAEVVPAGAPQPDRARGVKYGLLAFVLGFLLSMGIAYFRDKARTRRRARTAAERAAADLAPPSDPRPAPGATAQPTWTPIGDLLDDEDDEEGFEDEEELPAAVPASRATSPEPTNGSRSRTRKAPPALLPAPVKFKARSRNP